MLMYKYKHTTTSPDKLWVRFRGGCRTPRRFANIPDRAVLFRAFHLLKPSHPFPRHSACSAGNIPIPPLRPLRETAVFVPFETSGQIPHTKGANCDFNPLGRLTGSNRAP